jgi:hypothetical protein
VMKHGSWAATARVGEKSAKHTADSADRACRCSDGHHIECAVALRRAAWPTPWAWVIARGRTYDGPICRIPFRHDEAKIVGRPKLPATMFSQRRLRLQLITSVGK